MTTITYYYRKMDDPTGEIKAHLTELGNKLDFSLLDICLDDNPDLTDRFQEEVSSLQIGPYRLRFPFDDIDIQIAVRAYQDRKKLHQNDSEKAAEIKPQPIEISSAERFSYWLSNNYVWFLNIILFLFVGLPFLAPVLMKENHKAPAQVIYSVYSVFCHQLAFRSFFLFGEQAVYPRELANVPNLLTYEAVTGNSALDTATARAFEGNDQLGYKVAICERDIAIYGALLLAGILFQLSGRKLKAIPWYIWVIFAVIPMGIDGGTQLFSLGGTWPVWFPIRESTPFLRVITGVLFGFFTAWYIYPMMEENMKDIRVNLARKLTIKRKLQQREKVQ
jgi:uncharacterized membrane protein